MRKLATGVLVAALLAATAVAAVAPAETVRQGRLVVIFDGSIAPAKLPLRRAVPVGVRLSVRASTIDDSALPRLRRFAMAINRYGRLRTDGLRSCRLRQIVNATATDALAACGDSLVGRGRFGALVDLPDQPQGQISGRLFAFNSRYRGRPAILAHVHSPRPVHTSVTFPITIRRARGGPYGITFTARLAGLLNATVYTTDFVLNLGGRFAAPGPPQGYLAAPCPAPRGFSLVNFPLARGAFHFAGGLRVVEHLTRSCRVRR